MCVVGRPNAEPYEVEYVGSGAARSGSAWQAGESGLEGGTATVKIAQTASPGNEIIASATNVGATTDGRPVTIEDTLPAGVQQRG